MSFIDELKAVSHVIIETIKNYIIKREYTDRYGRIIVVTLAIMCISFASFLAYRYYISNREQKTYALFAEYMDDFNRASQAGSVDMLQSIENSVSLAYAQHKGSYIAPLFLIIKADAQLQQKKMAQAIDTLYQAINELPQSSPIQPLIKFKQALLLLDSADEEIQKNGVEIMVRLARDKMNQFSDFALFYLGRYYWAQNNIQEAKNSWQELVDAHSTEQAYPSIWAEEARLALSQLVG